MDLPPLMAPRPHLPSKALKCCKQPASVDFKVAILQFKKSYTLFHINKLCFNSQDSTKKSLQPTGGFPKSCPWRQSTSLNWRITSSILITEESNLYQNTWFIVPVIILFNSIKTQYNKWFCYDFTTRISSLAKT